MSYLNPGFKNVLSWMCFMLILFLVIPLPASSTETTQPAKKTTSQAGTSTKKGSKLGNAKKIVSKWFKEITQPDYKPKSVHAKGKKIVLLKNEPTITVSKEVIYLGFFGKNDSFYDVTLIGNGCPKQHFNSERKGNYHFVKFSGCKFEQGKYKATIDSIEGGTFKIQENGCPGFKPFEEFVRNNELSSLKKSEQKHIYAYYLAFKDTKCVFEAYQILSDMKDEKSKRFAEALAAGKVPQEELFKFK